MSLTNGLLIVQAMFLGVLALVESMAFAIVASQWREAERAREEWEADFDDDDVIGLTDPELKGITAGLRPFPSDTRYFVIPVVVDGTVKHYVQVNAEQFAQSKVDGKFTGEPISGPYASIEAFLKAKDVPFPGATKPIPTTEPTDTFRDAWAKLKKERGIDPPSGADFIRHGSHVGPDTFHGLDEYKSERDKATAAKAKTEAAKAMSWAECQATGKPYRDHALDRNPHGLTMTDFQKFAERDAAEHPGDHQGKPTGLQAAKAAEETIPLLMPFPGNPTSLEAAIKPTRSVLLIPDTSPDYAGLR